MNLDRIKNARIRNLSVSRRLLYSFLLMAIVPLLIFGIISYQVSNSAINSKISNSSIQVLKLVQKNIQYESDKYQKISDALMVNKTVQDGLYRFDTWDYMQKNNFIVQMNSVISGHKSNSPQIMQIFLTDRDNNPIYSQGWFYVSQETIDRMIDLCGKNINWLSVNEGNKNYIIYTHPVISERGSGVIGHTLIFIDAAAFYNCLSGVDMGTGADLMVMDYYGNNVANQDRTFRPGTAVDGGLFSYCRENPDRNIIRNYKFNGRLGMIAYSFFTRQGWLLVAAIPDAYLRSETFSIAVTSLISIVLCFLCAVIVYRQMWKSISVPINRLVQLVGKIDNTNFDQMTFYDDSKDELGFLSRAFREILQKMQDLVKQVETEQKQKREYELKMLQAQINPHFLFNTLNSLRWTALMSRATSVSNGLAALSDLLRNTILDKNEFITVEEELKNVSNYIVIQKIRYGDIFSVTYEIDENILHCYMIKFLLQPIVENSIIHGIDEDGTQKEIHISMNRREDTILTVISDNGKGFDVEKTLDAKKNKRLTGIGMQNVQERIRLCFGREYPFNIESRIGEGTTVTMEFPYIGTLLESTKELTQGKEREEDDSGAVR